MNRPYTVGDLRKDLKDCPDHEEIVVAIEDGAEHLDELEEGSVLNITEAGGWSQGMRLIRVKPR